MDAKCVNTTGKASEEEDQVNAYPHFNMEIKCADTTAKRSEDSDQVSYLSLNTVNDENHVIEVTPAADWRVLAHTANATPAEKCMQPSEESSRGKVDRSTQKSEPLLRVVYDRMRHIGNELLHEEFMKQVDVRKIYQIAKENDALRAYNEELRKKLQKVKTQNLQSVLYKKVYQFKSQVVSPSTSLYEWCGYSENTNSCIHDSITPNHGTAYAMKHALEPENNQEKQYAPIHHVTTTTNQMLGKTHFNLKSSFLKHRNDRHGIKLGPSSASTDFSFEGNGGIACKPSRKREVIDDQGGHGMVRNEALRQKLIRDLILTPPPSPVSNSIVPRMYDIRTCTPRTGLVLQPHRTFSGNRYKPY